MMDLSEKQWLKHVVFHPFEGFEDMRWKRSGSLKIAFSIVLLFFVGTVVWSRLYAFHFWSAYDKLFNIVPFIVKSILLFAVWVIGNWAVCTLLDGEGTLKRICIFSAYSLVPYVTSLYMTTIMSHFLTHDESIFIECVYYLGMGWSCLLMFNAIKTVHQYSVIKTVVAILLTIAAMFIIMFLLILIMSLFQKVIIFIYSLYTEIQYRFRI